MVGMGIRPGLKGTNGKKQKMMMSRIGLSNHRNPNVRQSPAKSGKVRHHTGENAEPHKPTWVRTKAGKGTERREFWQTANSGQQQSISREKDCHAFGKVKGQGKPRKAEQFCVFRIAQRETTTKQTKGLALSIRLNTIYMYRVVKEKK